MRILQPAPPFVLPSDDGEPCSVESFRGQWVVLVFYPRDFSPVCTRQLCHYRDRWEELALDGVVVLGVSPDSVERHREFQQRYGVPFRLLSDPALEVFRRYRMAIAGRLPARGVVIVDPVGRVRYWWRSLTGLRYPSARAIRERLLAIMRTEEPPQ